MGSRDDESESKGFADPSLYFIAFATKSVV